MTLIQDSKKQKKGKGCVLKAVLAKGERGTFQTENVLAISLILERNFQEDFKDEFSEEFSPPEGFEEGEFIPFEDEFNEFDNSGEGSFSFGTGIEGSFEEDNSGSSDSSGGSSEEITSEESPDEITGSFITGNVFLDYRFG